jgi:hypothetical protein
MAFNDLSQTAKDGLNYLATIMLDTVGAPRFATGKEVLDHFGEVEGSRALAAKDEQLTEARRRKVKVASAAVLSALDATVDPG